MLTVHAAKIKTVDVLIAKSHSDYIDLSTDLPWTMHDRELPLKRECSSWIYGTEHWCELTPEQRRELQKEELARDVSMFIQLEETLPVLYQGYVNRYGGTIAPSIRDYLSLFSKEEIIHILMFQRFLATTELPLYPAPEGYKELFLEKLPGMHPIYGIAATLMTEILAEDGAMFATQSDEIDPLTRTIFFKHHREELRHIAFGKLLVQSFLENASSEDAAALRRFISGVTQKTVRNYLFNPEILARLSFALPKLTDHDAVRYSDHNRATNPIRFPTLFDFCRQLGLTSAEISPFFA